MMMSSTIKFSKDRTFSMALVGAMKGTWRATGHQLALTITDLNGTPMSDIVAMARSNYADDPSPRHKAALDESSKPLIAVLSSDGRTLTFKPAPGKATLVFTRA